MKFLMDNNHMLFIMQFVFALLVLGVWLYMIATGQNPPDALTSLVTLVIGFFFGSQVTEMVQKAREK